MPRYVAELTRSEYSDAAIFEVLDTHADHPHRRLICTAPQRSVPALLEALNRPAASILSLYQEGPRTEDSE
jgi:hypothetical protein